MHNWGENLIKSAANISSQVRTNVVFNCLLWMLPLPIIALIFVSFTSNAAVQYFLMGLIGLIVLVIIILFIIILAFGLKGHPELFQLLRSEEHVYKMAALEKLGDEKHIFTDLANSSGKTNPNQPDPSGIFIPKPEDVSSIEETHHE